MKGLKRDIEIVVISDIHLGTGGCRAKDLLTYLKSVNPKILIMNGDVIDIWQFKKRYFPKTHIKIIKHIINLSTKQTKVYYVTGNHDEMLRKFTGVKLGKLEIVNNLTLDIDGKKAWFFHGDVFDVIMQHSKWLAKLGAISYDSLIAINVFINRINAFLGREKVSLSKKIKNSVKSALRFINDFEKSAIELAVNKKYDYIVCGHIHHPQMSNHIVNNHTITYLNSGDWIENLTALEYNNGEWNIYYHTDQIAIYNTNKEPEESEMALVDFDNKYIFNQMLQEIQEMPGVS